MTSASQETIRPRAAVANRHGPRFSWLPKRWYAHLLLILACFLSGLPLFYALLVSTQTNAEVFQYKFTPGTGLLDNWDVVFYERHLHTYMLNSVVMTLGITVSKKWFVLPAAVAGFLLQHAVQGWCPPLPILRRMGFRTASEIDYERYALKALRGDFRNVSEAGTAGHALAAAEC